ncbi:hypothetical protein GQ568_00705 [Patescibacteria group bacterium]|nr:hypothetical protein [Patescibacteria group bacterium]
MEQQVIPNTNDNLWAQMPGIEFEINKTAKEFVKRREAKVLSAILKAGKGTRHWTTEELPGVAWKILVDKYPQETKGITEYQAVEEIKWHVFILCHKDKFKIVVWSEDSYGLALLETK